MGPQKSRELYRAGGRQVKPDRTGAGSLPAPPRGRADPAASRQPGRS